MVEHIQVPLNPPNLEETQKSCKYTFKKYWQHWQLLQLKGKITQTLQIYSCTHIKLSFIFIHIHVCIVLMKKLYAVMQMLVQSSRSWVLNRLLTTC